jgi:hypothetical protein
VSAEAEGPVGQLQPVRGVPGVDGPVVPDREADQGREAGTQSEAWIQALKQGDRVYVAFDNAGSSATVVATRDGPGRCRVRLDRDSQEFWANDFELEPL